MALQHRAFLFDFDAFHRTLKATLEDALRSGPTDALLLFVEQEREKLKDPYEGDPLPAKWHELFDAGEAHEIGDVALTMFYDPKDDRGLGADWEAAASTLEPISTALGFSPLLGRIVGPQDNPFDPGKMGAYFLSGEDVERVSGAIAGAPVTKQTTALAQLLEDAKSAGLGLYITF